MNGPLQGRMAPRKGEILLLTFSIPSSLPRALDWLAFLMMIPQTFHYKVTHCLSTWVVLLGFSKFLNNDWQPGAVEGALFRPQSWIPALALPPTSSVVLAGHAHSLSGKRGVWMGPSRRILPALRFTDSMIWLTEEPWGTRQPQKFAAPWSSITLTKFLGVDSEVVGIVRLIWWQGKATCEQRQCGYGEIKSSDFSKTYPMLIVLSQCPHKYIFLVRL